MVDKFTLSMALENDYLCQYEYHPIYVHLNDEEQEEYLNLSYRIARAINSEDKDNLV